MSGVRALGGVWSQTCDRIRSRLEAESLQVSVTGHEEGETRHQSHKCGFCSQRLEFHNQTVSFFISMWCCHMTVQNTLQGFACVCDGVPGTDWTGISFFHWLKSLFTGGDVETVAMAAGSQVNNNRFSEVTADFQGTQSRDRGKKPRTGRWNRKPVCYHLSGLGVVVCQGRVWPLAAGENSRPTFTPTPSFVFMPISERFQRDKTKAHS